MFDLADGDVQESYDSWIGLPEELLLDNDPSPAAVEPSGWLALELDQRFSVPEELSERALVDAVVGFERVVAWAQARRVRLIAELAARRGDDPARPEVNDAADELGVVLHLSRGTAVTRVCEATELVTRLAATLELWEQGRLDRRRVAAIAEATRVLPEAQAVAVESRVLPHAPEQTVAQLRAALRRAVIVVDPEGAEARHRVARAGRRVAVNPEPDGMASLWALLPAPDAVASFEWLTRLARGLGSADPRRMDQRRADLLADLLTGRLQTVGAELPAPVNPGKPLIQVVVPLATLTGAADAPGELLGYGPVPAGLAREIAADAVWRRLVTDPMSGALLDHGRTTYTPPAALADFVRARDQHCRFPGCRRRLANGELDHVLPYPNGPTSAANLAGYCIGHHHVKHRVGWRVRALPDGGLEWRTPTGRIQVTRPFDYRDL